MPEYLAPGVYIEEVPSANKAIQAASTSTAGMVGVTERGPINTPTLVTSEGAFRRIFGGMLDHGTYTEGKDALPHAVRGFFTNGGSRLYVVRVLGAGAKRAKVALSATNAKLQANALSEGAGGNAIRVSINHSSVVDTKLTAEAAKDAEQLTVATTFGMQEGTILVCEGQRFKVTQVVSPTMVAIGSKVDPKIVADTPVSSEEFDLLIEKIVKNVAVETELFTNLSLAPEHSNYAPRVLGSSDKDGANPSATGDSLMIRLHHEVPANPKRPDVAVLPLDNGEDGALDASTYRGTASDDPALRTGIHAMQNEPAINIVAVPGQTDVNVQKDLLTHCAKMSYRFAVLDSPAGASPADARNHRNNFDDEFGAIYYPSLVVADPFGGKGDTHVIPPSGHVLGVYARTDTTRGVWKSPANEVVRGIMSFDLTVNRGENDILNPIHVNCLRDFRSSQRGLRVWGGRTLSSNPEWRYVTVRRTFLFIEQSLDAGLQWAVFEPNGQALWDTVRQSITGFLDSIWRQGGLAGTTQEQAFFVNVGYGVTMEQADLDNGRLIVEVGIAPLYPAEFVIIRISQKTLEATG